VRDHLGIAFSAAITKPPRPRKEVTCRKTNGIDFDAFARDIENCVALNQTDGSADELVTLYNRCLSEILDRHAPMCTRVITLRPETPWYNEEIRNVKHQRRKWEKKWRASKLAVHAEIHRDLCQQQIRLIQAAKTEYLSNKIEECGHDQRKLFKVAKSLLGESTEPVLPEHTSPEDLANDFARYFSEKIDTIREAIVTSADSIMDEFETEFSGMPLCTFSPASEAEVARILTGAPSKSCSSDPMPTWLLKKVIPQLTPVITAIINKSLGTAIVPRTFKHAVVRPLLKKPGLDPNNKKHYRPVSNLPFIAKCLEKIVCSRINDHLQSNDLHESMQSAYRKFHSTETALLKVQGDILEALDQGHSVALILLDLSAAFDTLQHNTLLRRLQQTHGIVDSALEWMKSYFCDRTQAVAINSCVSNNVVLSCGVPQGSVVGPLGYSLYTLPLGAILRKHHMQFAIYADDTQCYTVLKANADWNDVSTRISLCYDEIHQWMSNNHLKLNDEKTEFIFFSNRLHVDPSIFTLRCGEARLKPATTVRNLGVLMDSTSRMERYANQIARVSRYHLRRIAKIRRVLTMDACRSLVQSLVLSRLDYANSLLYGSPKRVIQVLQRVQNSAARVVAGVGIREHITPVLIDLHWLPVAQRIHYKILLLTFKALNGLAPAYLQERLQTQSDRPRRTQHQHLLRVPRARCRSFGERAFSHAAPTLWNTLPPNMRDVTCVTAFKKQLKTHLFRTAYF
jgi:hypothetical protein